MFGNSQHEALPGPLVITDRPTGLDWAYSIRQMLEAGSADADRMILVMDNLNTPNIVSLNLAFSPDNMGSLADYRKTRHTTKQGSRLNGAGIGRRDLKRQCHSGRIDCKKNGGRRYWRGIVIAAVDKK